MHRLFQRESIRYPFDLSLWLLVEFCQGTTRKLTGQCSGASSGTFDGKTADDGVIGMGEGVGIGYLVAIMVILVYAGVDDCHLISSSN